MMDREYDPEKFCPFIRKEIKANSIIPVKKEKNYNNLRIQTAVV